MDAAVFDYFLVEAAVLRMEFSKWHWMVDTGFACCVDKKSRSRFLSTKANTVMRDHHLKCWVGQDGLKVGNFRIHQSLSILLGHLDRSSRCGSLSTKVTKLRTTDIMHIVFGSI